MNYRKDVILLNFEKRGSLYDSPTFTKFCIVIIIFDTIEDCSIIDKMSNPTSLEKTYFRLELINKMKIFINKNYKSYLKKVFLFCMNVLPFLIFSPLDFNEKTWFIFMRFVAWILELVIKWFWCTLYSRVTFFWNYSG